MAALKTQELKIAVRIEVPQGWSSLSKNARGNAVARMSTYCDNLLECLRLPATAALTIGQRASLPVDVVLITTELDQQRVSPAGLCVIDAEGWKDADEAFMAMARALFCARELLLTDDLVAGAWNTLPNRSRVRDPKLRRWLLHECARYGIDTRFLAENLSKPNIRVESQQDALRFFENAIQYWFGTLRLWFAPSLYDQFYGESQPAPGATEPEERSFVHVMETVNEAMFNDFGVHFANVDPVSDDDIEENWFQLQINGLPLPPTKGLGSNQLLAGCAPEALLAVGIDANGFRSPVTGGEWALVTGADRRRTIEEAGHQVWGARGYVALHILAAVRKNLGALYTHHKWMIYGLQLSVVMPELVERVLETWDTRDLVRILRYLLDEEISVRDMESILDFLADPPEVAAIDWSKKLIFTLTRSCPVPDTLLPDGRNITPSAMGELTRMTLRRYVSHKHTRGSNRLSAYLVHKDAEEVLSGRAFEGLLEPEARGYASRFRDAVRKEVGFVAPDGDRPVILTNAELRRRMRELLRLEFPYLHVLSYQDLVPDLEITAIGRIEVS